MSSLAGQPGRDCLYMECAAHGGAVADVCGFWHSPRSARRQSGVRAAAVHKSTNRSQRVMKHDPRSPSCPGSAWARSRFCFSAATRKISPFPVYPRRLRQRCRAVYLLSSIAPSLAVKSSGVTQNLRPFLPEFQRLLCKFPISQIVFHYEILGASHALDAFLRDSL
jgi:hypothetical protein